MLTRQEMEALVGRTLIIREFPHICLAAGDDALLLLGLALVLLTDRADMLSVMALLYILM